MLPTSSRPLKPYATLTVTYDGFGTKQSKAARITTRLADQFVGRLAVELAVALQSGLQKSVCWLCLFHSFSLPPSDGSLHWHCLMEQGTLQSTIHHQSLHYLDGTTLCQLHKRVRVIYPTVSVPQNLFRKAATYRY